MAAMFVDSEFNSDISSWNVSSVTNMTGMFYNSKFNGDISEWNVSSVEKYSDIFYKCPLENQPHKQPLFR